MSYQADQTDGSSLSRPRLPSIAYLLNLDSTETDKQRSVWAPEHESAPVTPSSKSSGSIAYLGVQANSSNDSRPLNRSQSNIDLPIHTAPPSPPQSDGSMVYSRSSSVSTDAAVAVGVSTSVNAVAQRLAKRRARSCASRRMLCAQCGHRDCHIPGHIKTRKEKKSRKDQQRVHQYTEDSLEFIAGVDRSDHKRQSSGNGDVSGLQYSKIETMDGWLAVAVTRLQMLRDQAIAAGCLADFEAENKDIFERALASGNPVANTSLLASGDEVCEHGGRQKGCEVHGHADWTECRKQRAAANVARHDAAVRASASAAATPSHPTHWNYSDWCHVKN